MQQRKGKRLSTRSHLLHRTKKRPTDAESVGLVSLIYQLNKGSNMSYTTILDSAQEYVSLGFSVFPCRHINEDGSCSCGKKGNCHSPGKHPKTRQGVKDATNNPDTINEYFSKDCNIGIATGEPSGLWVLDDDDIAANKAITDTLPRTWTAKTGGGGRHYFFRHTETTKRLKNVKGIGVWKMDVRSTGGYVIAPPSNHISGGKYEWIISPHECEIAEAPDWLIRLIPKHEDDQRGVMVVAASPRTTAPSNAITVHEPDDELTERARAYLAKCEPAISKQGGDDRTFKVACNLVELFGGLPDDELLDLLREWNDRCEPPWLDSRLKYKLSQARKKTTTERRVIISDTQPEAEDEADEDGDAGLWTFWPSLDGDALHGLLGEIVGTIEPETEADSAGILVSLLTSFGNSVGNGPRLPVGAGVHHSNLFTCLVGDTASGKGQAWSIASRIMKRADPEWYRECLARGLSSGEGFVERLNDPDSDDPFSVPPLKRLLCLQSEFARPITAMRREGNTLSPILRSAWDCEPLEVMTRGKSKLRASNAFVSVLAQITPDELRKILTNSVEVVNGFANRFLWCLVRCQRLLPHGGNVAVLDAFDDRLRIALEKAKTIRDMRRSTEADRLWETVYPELKRSRKGAYGRTVDRACPQVVRLSMIYALADGLPTIESDHLKAALAVWNYCDESARILFGEDENEGDSVSAKILEVLQEGPKTKTEIRQRLSSSARSRYSDVLEELERSGRIRLDGQRYSLDAGRSGLLDSTRSSVQNVQSPESPNVQESKRPASTESQTSKSPESRASTQSLADLLDWKNMNGVVFERNSEGSVWVSSAFEPKLTDGLRQAILANQETLAAFVPKTETDDLDDITLSVNGEQFFNELTKPKTETEWSRLIRQATSG